MVHPDEFYMDLAMREAHRAGEAGEVPVGAVLVHPERGIVGKAHNQVETLKDATAHAEVLAITQASAALEDWRLEDCTLYVTKEPCPMCSGALVIARIGRVFYGLPDEKMGCVGGACDLGALPRSNHQFESVGGILQELNHTLLRAFFEEKRQLGSSKDNSSTVV